MYMILIAGTGGEERYSLELSSLCPPYTPLPRSHAPHFALSLSQHRGATSCISSEGWVRFDTRHRVEAEKHNCRERNKKKKSDTCTNAQEGKRRQMKASAAGPLAAVRHVGGGALFTVPCPTQSSKHLPSPWTLAPWLCGCWWAGWNDHGEWETQGNALDAAARWEDSLILDPSSSTDASDLLHRCMATEESLAVQTEGL